MADPKPKKSPTEDELLANAIPIDVGEEPAEEELKPIDVSDVGGPTAPVRPAEVVKHAVEEKWSRTPNANGQGAIHVRTFVSKLRLDAIQHLDIQVNEWLDAHPGYEVKMANATVGPLSGKTTEPAIFLTVWV